MNGTYVLAAIILFNILGLSPLLLFGSTRKLFGNGKAQNVVAYLLVSLGVSLLQMFAILSNVISSEPVGTNAFFVLTYVTVCIILVALIGICIILPYFDVWNPKIGGGFDGRVAFIITTTVYSALFYVIGIFVFSGLTILEFFR